MKSNLSLAILVLGIAITISSWPVLAKEKSSSPHKDYAAKHITGHQAPAGEHTEKAAEEHAGDNEQPVHKELGKGHSVFEEQGKHTESETGEHEAPTGHKEYPKLSEGTQKIAYLAIGFILFVLIAVPLGAHLEKNKHPSHH
jgi:hypothetical protein